MIVGPVLTQLRLATGDIHRRLDAGLDAVNRLERACSRPDMIRGYFAFHKGVDAAVAPWLAEDSGLDYAARRRTPALRRAVKAMNLAESPPRRRFPALGNRAQAYGALYVVEGSVLGGRLIRNTIAERGRDLDGLDFLDPYGTATGERWRTFLAQLEIGAVHLRASTLTPINLEPVMPPAAPWRPSPSPKTA